MKPKLKSKLYSIAVAPGGVCYNVLNYNVMQGKEMQDMKRLFNETFYPHINMIFQELQEITRE